MDKKNTKAEATSAQKRPYVAPMLIEHGNVVELTRGGGSGQMDFGPPPEKN